MPPIDLPPPLAPEGFATHDFESANPAETYHWLNSMVVPRPIAFATTIDESGRVNAAPFSYFNVVTPNPPIVSLSIGRRAGAAKDTLRNVLTSGELVVNATVAGLAPAASAAAGDFEPEVSEVELLGLATLPSVTVSPPRLAASPWHLECVLEYHREVGNVPFTLILARVRTMHVHASILDDRGRIDPLKLDPVGRLAGLDFARLGEVFALKRGL